MSHLRELHVLSDELGRRARRGRGGRGLRAGAHGRLLLNVTDTVTHSFRLSRWGTADYILLKIWSNPSGKVPRP